MSAVRVTLGIGIAALAIALLVGDDPVKVWQGLAGGGSEAQADSSSTEGQTTSDPPLAAAGNERELYAGSGRNFLTRQVLENHGVVGDVAELTVEGATPVKKRRWYRGNSFIKLMGEKGTGKPVVLTGCPHLGAWPAFKRWNPYYLGRQLTNESSPSIRVKETAYPITRMHSKVAPLGGAEGVEWLRPWKGVNVSTEAFFNKSGHEHPDDGQYWLYFSALDKLNERINMDVWPREFFYADVQDGDFFHLYPNAHTEIMEVNTWISPAGTTTPAHYDLPHNFYIQVSGRKRFVLYPPDQWPDMYLFPRLHPASRMSQIDWEALASDDDTLRSGAEARFPGVANLTKQEIVIYPGEILYIPPYWGHHVTAEDLSISVSVHLKSPQVQNRHIMNKYLTPFQTHWTDDQKIGALEVALRHYFDTGQEAAAVLRMIVDSRYGPVAEDRFVRGLDKAIASERLYTRLLDLPPTPPELFDQIVDYATTFKKVVLKRYHQQSVRDVETANYIEDITMVACGKPERVPHVLRFILDRWESDPNFE